MAASVTLIYILRKYEGLSVADVDVFYRHWRWRHPTAESSGSMELRETLQGSEMRLLLAVWKGLMPTVEPVQTALQLYQCTCDHTHRAAQTGWGVDKRQKQRDKAGHVTGVDQYAMWRIELILTFCLELPWTCTRLPGPRPRTGAGGAWRGAGARGTGAAALFLRRFVVLVAGIQVVLWQITVFIILFIVILQEFFFLFQIIQLATSTCFVKFPATATALTSSLYLERSPSSSSSSSSSSSFAVSFFSPSLEEEVLFTFPRYFFFFLPNYDTMRKIISQPPRCRRLNLPSQLSEEGSTHFIIFTIRFFSFNVFHIFPFIKASTISWEAKIKWTKSIHRSKHNNNLQVQISPVRSSSLAYLGVLHMLHSDLLAQLTFPHL